MDESSNAVNEPVVADTTSTESAPVDTTSSEVASDAFDKALNDDLDPAETESKPIESEETTDESNEESNEESSEESETEETQDDEQADETETEEQPRGKAEERKQQLNTEIRDLVSQRNAIREEVERLNSEAYQPATEDELLEQVNPDTGDYYNKLEAKIASMEQRQEVERYNTQVADAQLTLTSEANRALQDFPMFDSNSPEYDADVASQVDQMLGEALVFDQKTNQVIGSHLSPYKLYQTVYKAQQASSVKGRIDGQKATEKMLASADTKSNAPTAAKKTDPILEALMSD